MANAQKAKEFDEQILRINLEKEEIIRQKEIIVEQVTREKKILQVRNWKEIYNDLFYSLILTGKNGRRKSFERRNDK